MGRIKPVVETVGWDLIFDLFNYSQTMGRIKPVCRDSRVGSDIWFV